MSEIIIVNDVSKSYDQPVLQNIDLIIETGVIHGFIGPSGSGKTTLMRMIAGLESPSSGSIYIKDLRVPDLSLLLTSATWHSQMPSIWIYRVMKI